MAPVSVKDVDQQQFTIALAAFLKKSGKMAVPEWVDIVKTGIAKELAPYDEDWFFTRTASVARHIYIRAPVGVASVQKIYGVRKNNGSSPSHWSTSSGSVARRALQALEKLKLVEKDPNGGRRMTGQGRRDLDRIAAQIKTQQGASLQNYNNELVKCLEDLREKREQINREIAREEDDKNKIQNDLKILTERLSRINDSLARKVAARNEYDQTIQETEAAYLKILESSQTLLHVLKRESANMNKKRQASS